MSEELKAELNYLVREVQYAGCHRCLAYHGDDITNERIEYDALLPLSNVLFLRHRGLPSANYFAAAEDGKKCISTSGLVRFVYDKLKACLNVKVKSNEISRKDADDFLLKSTDSIKQLSYQLDVYPIIESISSFKCLPESSHLKLFELLDVVLYCGLLPDLEKDKDTYELVQGEFHSDLLEIARNPDPDRPADELIKNFIFNEIGFTPYGFDCLQSQVPELSLSIMWQNTVTSVLIKRLGVIYILSPRETYPDTMWMSVENAHGDGKLFTSNFTAVIAPSGIMAVNLIKEDEKAKNEKEKKQRKKDRKRNKNLKGQEQQSQSDMPSTQNIASDHHSV